MLTGKCHIAIIKTLEYFMKKVLILASIVFALAGCEATHYSVLIKNNSSKTVSYVYNGSPDTLDPGKSKNYEVEAYIQPPANISVPGALSVAMNRHGDTFTFVDADEIILKVVNTLSIAITIKADNYIWDKNNNSVELSIPENSKREDDLVIYTSNPRFTSTSSYPVSIDWNLSDNTIFVTIR
jgi:hypothetical protein